jgi:hypothetical protein
MPEAEQDDVDRLFAPASVASFVSGAVGPLCALCSWRARQIYRPV